MACNYNYGKNDYILEDCSLFKPQSLNKKPIKPLQTFPDDSNFRNNGSSSFGFMISVLFNILQFVTIWILISMILK